MKKMYKWITEHEMLALIINQWAVAIYKTFFWVGAAMVAVNLAIAGYGQIKKDIKSVVDTKEAIYMAELVQLVDNTINRVDDVVQSVVSIKQQIQQVKNSADLIDVIPANKKSKKNNPLGGKYQNQPLEKNSEKASGPAVNPRSIPGFATVSLGAAEEINAWRDKLRLPRLQPSVTLEAEALARAQELAEVCQLDNHARKLTKYGETLYLGQSAIMAVTAWAAERNYYDADTGICSPGRVCGHWTQMTWEKTQEIGCAEAGCGDGNGGRIVVCEYYPAGNVVGQKPY